MPDTKKPVTLENLVASAKKSADESFNSWRSFPDAVARNIGTHDEYAERIVNISLQTTVPSSKALTSGGKATSVWLSQVLVSAPHLLDDLYADGSEARVGGFILGAIEQHVREQVEAHVATLIATIEDEEVPGLPTP